MTASSAPSLDPAKRLAYLFRADRKARPIMLLGAGASFRSGVPLAADGVRRIARAAFARNVRGLDEHRCNLTQSDWLPYLQNQPWYISDPNRFSENWPLAVENLLVPKEFRREFLQTLIHPVNEISCGYHALARIIVKRLCWTVLTTNFDSLLIEALRQHRPQPTEIVEINRTADDLVRFGISNRCQVVYLHGAVEFYRDKNLRDETEQLDKELVRSIRPLLNDSPLLVVGYRGSEPSIMKHLLMEGMRESNKYRHGIYWCLRAGEDPHPNVLSLQGELGANFEIVRIVGFDELITALDVELADDVWYTSAEATTLANKQAPVTAPGSQDQQPLCEKSMDDLDHEVILATLAEYSRRLRLPNITKENYISFLEEQRFLARTSGRLVPTLGCYLLFGKEVDRHYPYAKIAFITKNKKQSVFGGNLISQFRRISEILASEEVNPQIRIKGEKQAEEQPAYPQRALTELTVNLLVHRDYTIQQYSRIEFFPGKKLTFLSPGGVTQTVYRHLHVGHDHSFVPTRGLTDLRNPLIADVFFGIGSMDKAGSGMADVCELMVESGGSAEYMLLGDNTEVRATVSQAVQSDPGVSRVARRVAPFDVYTTNLLPFKVLPGTIWFMPLRQKFLADAPLFEKGEDPHSLPIFLLHRGVLVTFADLVLYHDFADRRGHLKQLRSMSLAELLTSDDSHLFPWLVNKHWEFLLRARGLSVDRRKRRSFFPLVQGDCHTVTYNSRLRSNVQRDVVKKRGSDLRPYFENEAVSYNFVHFHGEWAMQIRPTYVFTQKDGRTPVHAMAQTRYATRRFKFDRNKNVDDDLSFWAKFLSSGQNVISIGGSGVADLIVDSEYCFAEVPRFGREEAAPDEDAN